MLEKYNFLFDEVVGLAYNAVLVGQLAQLVEQRIENPRVRGSIPRLATSKIKHLGQSSGVGLFAFGGHCSPIAPAAFNADA